MVTAEWIDFGTSDLNHASLEVVECTASGFVVDIILPGFGQQLFFREWNDVQCYQRTLPYPVR